MTPAELLAEVARRGVRVIEWEGRTTLDYPAGAVDEEFMATCRARKWVFVWGMEGARTGHRWHACDRCGEVQLQHHRSQPLRCTMTPACAGRMRPTPDVFDVQSMRDRLNVTPTASTP